MVSHFRIPLHVKKETRSSSLLLTAFTQLTCSERQPSSHSRPLPSTQALATWTLASQAPDRTTPQTPPVKDQGKETKEDTIKSIPTFVFRKINLIYRITLENSPSTQGSPPWSQSLHQQGPSLLLTRWVPDAGAERNGP